MERVEAAINDIRRTGTYRRTLSDLFAEFEITTEVQIDSTPTDTGAGIRLETLVDIEEIF